MPPEAFGVVGVAALLEMTFDGYHQHGFAQVERLGHGLEAGRRDHAVAAGHFFKKKSVVQVVKDQSGTGRPAVGPLRIVPEDVQADFGMAGVPADQVVGVAPVEQIDQQEVFGPVQRKLEQLGAQQRWHDEEPAFGQIGRFIERQRQLAGTRWGRQPREQSDQPALQRIARWKRIIWMQKKILMGDADQRRLKLCPAIEQADQHFVEIDDEIGRHVLNGFVQPVQASLKFRKV